MLNYIEVSESCVPARAMIPRNSKRIRWGAVSVWGAMMGSVLLGGAGAAACSLSASRRSFLFSFFSFLRHFPFLSFFSVLSPSLVAAWTVRVFVYVSDDVSARKTPVPRLAIESQRVFVRHWQRVWLP